MASGVECAAECAASYQAMKKERKYRYIVYKVDQGSSEDIIPEIKNQDREIEFTLNQKASEVNDRTKSAVTALSAYLHGNSKEPRYVVFNFAFASDERIQEKLIFILWSPCASPVKLKMLYASSKEALRRSVCSDITIDLQYDDVRDLEWDSLLRDVQHKLHS